MQFPSLAVETNRDGVVTRRAFLHRTAGLAAAGGAALLGWRDLLAAQAPELRRRGRAMILLWMDGGPSQFETFNPKPGSKNQGPARAIPTTIPGVRFAEYWPRTARVTDHIALIRSMVSSESEHDRAIALVRTGYPPTPTLRYPTWGSVVARELEDPEFELPAFVRIGKPRIATRDVDSGYLGPRYAPFKIDRPGVLPEDAHTAVPHEVLRRRLGLVQRLDRLFAEREGEDAVREAAAMRRRAERFVMSPRLEVFDLDREPARLRDAYGRTSFGQGCLLARRLVEAGVTFVEVISTGGRNDAGWDTHQKGFRDTPHLCGEVDPAYATLLRDLASRGLLDHVLVVWMGEFGRTPKLKKDGGRDHYAKGWLAALSGAGVQGGRVIGATDKDGVDVTDRPVGVGDLFTTFARVLGIDPEKEYVTPDGRPVRLVEGGEVVSELFS